MKLLFSKLQSHRLWHLGLSLVLANGLSIFLYLLRMFGTGSIRYWFLVWNLLLAWVPLAVALYLRRYLRQYRWLSIGGVALSLLWLGFLPNSFYLLSDLVHLESTGEVGVLFDSVLFASFIFNGFIAGFLSLYVVHLEMLKRLVRQRAHIIVPVALLSCSFAIYLGRSLRWNSWDVIVNPAGLLFDVSERFINPVAYPQAFLTTTTFFMLLTVMYAVAWQAIAVIAKQKPNK